jgi:hypothetical protein
MIDIFSIYIHHNRFHNHSVIVSWDGLIIESVRAKTCNQPSQQPTDTGLDMSLQHSHNATRAVTADPGAL